MPAYYMFDHDDKPSRWIGDSRGDDNPRPKWALWRLGTQLPSDEVIPVPVRFTLKKIDPADPTHGPHMPSYLDASVPLLTDELVKALLAGGANLDLYDCEITDPESGRVYTSYKAVNVLGEVTRVSMEGDANGHAFFRVIETIGLFVNEKMRDHLLSKGFYDLKFRKIDSSGAFTDDA